MKEICSESSSIHKCVHKHTFTYMEKHACKFSIFQVLKKDDPCKNYYYDGIKIDSSIESRTPLFSNIFVH